MFRRLFSRKRTLSGTPSIRRLKTYSAQTGYVYHYFFEGYRDYGSSRGEGGREFVFSISVDRKTWNETKLFLDNGAVQAWENSSSRELSSTERYAIAKMVLFQAFDERQPAEMKKDLRVQSADIATIVETLGL